MRHAHLLYIGELKIGSPGGALVSASWRWRNACADADWKLRSGNLLKQAAAKHRAGKQGGRSECARAIQDGAEKDSSNLENSVPYRERAQRGDHRQMYVRGRVS